MAKIYYFKHNDVQVFTSLMMGIEFMEGNNPDLLQKLKNKDISETHVFLKEVPFNDLDIIFGTMQGDVWSPNGEARELITSKGLKHTSMSVGDIVEMNGDFYFCDTVGWVKL